MRIRTNQPKRRCFWCQDLQAVETFVAHEKQCAGRGRFVGEDNVVLTRSGLAPREVDDPSRVAARSPGGMLVTDLPPVGRIEAVPRKKPMTARFTIPAGGFSKEPLWGSDALRILGPSDCLRHAFFFLYGVSFFFDAGSDRESCEVIYNEFRLEVESYKGLLYSWPLRVLAQNPVDLAGDSPTIPWHPAASVTVGGIPWKIETHEPYRFRLMTEAKNEVKKPVSCMIALYGIEVSAIR